MESIRSCTYKVCISFCKKNDMAIEAIRGHAKNGLCLNAMAFSKDMSAQNSKV